MIGKEKEEEKAAMKWEERSETELKTSERSREKETPSSKPLSLLLPLIKYKIFHLTVTTYIFGRGPSFLNRVFPTTTTN